jgi:predicted RNA-binding Zn-ribbon protein involved in translation (DUF1610 family)
MKKISICSSCGNQLHVTGWGGRAECPHCEKWVTVKVVEVKHEIKAKEGGKK